MSLHSPDLHSLTDPHDHTTSPDPLTALGFHAGPWAALLHEIEPAAIPARVIRADRGAATAMTVTDPVRITWHPASAPPITGDWVALDSDNRLLGIAPRRSAITRPAHHRGVRDEDSDQVLAANADLVGVVIGLDGEPNSRRLERGLVMAYESGATPLVILTKADLAEDLQRSLDQARSHCVGVDVVVACAIDGQGVADLRQRLAPDRTLAMLGASGTGKSSLTNAMMGEEVLSVGAVRAVDGKGRHTTSHREMVILPDGGAVLDTPGLRTLSLGQTGQGLDQAFPEIDQLAGDCRFADCRHDVEPGCAVLLALDQSSLTADRYEGWRRIRAESEAAALRADKARYRKVQRAWGAAGRQAQALAARKR
ncbi:MAG: ribosome small subunit-dependent GTPase A [Euzebya sp.]